MQIDLWFESKSRYVSTTERDKVLKTLCNISFLEESGDWSRIWHAIVDTGAHTTVLPEFIWKKIYFEPLSESLFLGVKSNLLCSIPCKVAKIYSMILDQNENKTKPFVMNAYLAKSNDVPVILGVSTALERFNLSIDYKNLKGNLQE